MQYIPNGGVDLSVSFQKGKYQKLKNINSFFFFFFKLSLLSALFQAELRYVQAKRNWVQWEFCLSAAAEPTLRREVRGCTPEPQLLSQTLRSI